MSYKRFLVKSIDSDEIVLDGEEHNHLKNVLRLHEGEPVIVTSGDGYDYLCNIEKINKFTTKLLVQSKSKNLQDPKINVTVYAGLLKGENMALVVQKLGELGVSKIVPYESKYTISKNSANKKDRLQKIADQSTKQCRRSIPLEVSNIVKFDKVVEDVRSKMYDLVIFAYEQEDNLNLSALLPEYSSAKNVAIIIGAEGGFSGEESYELIGAGAKCVTLGNRILRAETASIALSAVVIYSLGEWNRKNED